MRMTNGGVCLRETGELMDLIVAALWQGGGGENIPPSPSYSRNNEEIEDGASSRTRYLIVTLLRSPGNSEERARTARRPISSLLPSSLLAGNNCLCHNPFGHAPRQGLHHQRYNGVRCAVVTIWGWARAILHFLFCSRRIDHAHDAPWLEVK